MIKAIIIDDEWYTMLGIKKLAEEIGFIQVCGMYENPLTALLECKRILPQVAFVDIEMPEMDGLTLAEKLTDKIPGLQIIFITAYNQYAVQAFELNALDYLMKPIDPARFARMAEKVKKTLGVLPPPAPKIDIQCFDHFAVKLNGASIKWGRAKAEELFAYLLTNHKDEISKEVIVDTLWPEYEPAKALAILQTTVWKLRTIFSRYREQVSIEYVGGKYSLKIKDCDCDLFYVENTLNTFQTAGKNKFLDLDKACALVAHGYLKKNGFFWSYQKDEMLQEKLCGILYQMIDSHRKNKDAAAMVKYLKKLVQAVPFEDKANIMLIKLLLKMNEPKKARDHYAWLEKVLAEEYGVKPPKAISKLMW